MCETPSFRRFALDLLARLPEFHAAITGPWPTIDGKKKFTAQTIRCRRSAETTTISKRRSGSGTTHNPGDAGLRTTPRREIELTDRGEFRTRLPLAKSGDAAQGIDALQTLAEQGIKLRSKLC